MSEYGNYTTHKPASFLTHHPVAEKKAARRKLLAEVERRRRQLYRRYYAKMALKQAKYEGSLSNQIKTTA